MYPMAQVYMNHKPMRIHIYYTELYKYQYDKPEKKEYEYSNI